MTVPTNAAAYQGLQPNKSNRIGNIVEEHIRYWNEYEDSKKAKELERNARMAKIKAQQNKDFQKLYSGLTPEQNKGWLQSQVIKAFEHKKPMLADLARKASQGDTDAYQRLQNWKDKFDSLSKINKIYGEKAQLLNNQKNEGIYNEVLDKPIDDFRNAISSGMYKLNLDTLDFDVYSNGLDKEPIVMDSGSLLSNDYLTSSYTKAATPKKFGGEIAKTILDTIDGNKEINANTEKRGTRLSRQVLDTNDIEARTAYISYLNEKNIDPKTAKSFNDLSETEKNVIAKDYYTKNVLPQIQQVTKDTSLDDAIKSQRLKNLKKDSALKDKRLSKEETGTEYETISLKYDPKTDELINTENPGGGGFDIAFPKNISYGGTTNGNGAVFTSARYTPKDGNIVVSGYIMTEDEDGRKVSVPISTSDPQELGDIIKKIPDGKSSKSTFNNVIEFKKAVEEQLKNSRKEKGTSQTENKKEVGKLNSLFKKK